MAYTVAQNTSLYTIASVAQKAVSFVYFTIVARLIGTVNTGQYFIAISFTTIFAVIADFGFAPILTREAAKHEQDSERFLTTVLGAKTLFGILAYGLVILSSWLLGYSPELRLWIALSGITMLFDSWQGAFYGVLRARRNLLYESIGIVGSQIVTLVIGTIALFLHAPLYWLIIAYTVASALSMVYSAMMLHVVYGLRYRLVFDSAIFKQFLWVATPIAAAGIIGRLYSYTDSIMMSKMLPGQDLGWWSVPYKITFAFQFIPAALSASVYSVMSMLTVSEPNKIGELFVKSWRYLFLVVFPLSVGLGVIAKPVIVRLYGISYLPSVPVLRILLISLIFSFLTIITGALLNATNRQMTQTMLLTFALVSNVLLNIYFIPHYGIVGAAISACLSNLLLCALGLYFVARVTPFSLPTLASYAMRILIAAFGMGVIAYVLVQHFNFIAVIVVAVACYAILLFLFKGVDVAFVRELWQKASLKKRLV